MCLTFNVVVATVVVNRLVAFSMLHTLTEISSLSNVHRNSHCHTLKHTSVSWFTTSQFSCIVQQHFLKCTHAHAHTYSQSVWICIQCIQSHYYLHSFHCDDKFHAFCYIKAMNQASWEFGHDFNSVMMPYFLAFRKMVLWIFFGIDLMIGTLFSNQFKFTKYTGRWWITMHIIILTNRRPYLIFFILKEMISFM